MSMLPADTFVLLDAWTWLYFVIFLYLSVLFCKILKAKNGSLPTNWPIIGMLPGLLLNCYRVHDYVTDVLEAAGGTFFFKGPWLSNMDMMITSDPANVHYILSKNFPNFQKGPEFKKIFDILGDGIFNAEGEHWENHRRKSMPLLLNPNFQRFSATVTWEKLEKGLIPILDVASEMGTYVDLQELFKRFAFDSTCIQVLGHDFGTLRPDLPNLVFEKAFAEAEEAILLRHVLPESLWRLQEWLRIGKERKLAIAKQIIHGFLSGTISLKYNSWKMDRVKDDLDLLTGYMRTYPKSCDASPDSLMYIMLNFIAAGKDSISAALTWFFWLIAKHPEEQETIRQEILTNLSMDKGGKWSFTSIEELKALRHLHGALCETLRLFPPVPLQHKAPAEPDTLPSGHRITPNTRTVLSFYSMGRTESIWGRDCLNFKPERWITETGSMRSVPSFKFPAFNAGPRSCLGKEISFIQMKIVAAAIINQFHIQLMEDDHPVKPSVSVILHMKHGLKVKVSRRI